MSASIIKSIIEAAIFAAEQPLPLSRIQQVFSDDDRPEKEQIEAMIIELQQDYEARGIELIEVANGFRFQARLKFADSLRRLSEQKPPRYTRALLETLALIAYKQPITRAEIEAVRGVAVSSNIIRTLMEREWVVESGCRDVPGKPALLVTTKEFLDYFNLKSIQELPKLIEPKDLDKIEAEIQQMDWVVSETPLDESESEPLEETSIEDIERASQVVAAVEEQMQQKTDLQEPESEAESLTMNSAATNLVAMIDQETPTVVEEQQAVEAAVLETA